MSEMRVSGRFYAALQHPDTGNAALQHFLQDSVFLVPPAGLQTQLLELAVKMGAL